MANATYDFAPGRYFILQHTADGPSRIKGHETYGTVDEARRALESWVGHRDGQVAMIVQVQNLLRSRVTATLEDVTK